MPSFPSSINSGTSFLNTISSSAHPESETEHHTLQHTFSNFQLKNKTTTSQPTMISAKKLVQLAKKWQRMAALGRKRIMATAQETEECSISVAVKGHCIMYTADGRRFEVPLPFLATTIFVELLRMSQEEFGFASDGGITLPCDAELMEYVMCLLARNASEEVVRAFLSSIVRPCHYGNGLAPSVGFVQQVAASSF